MGITAAAVVVGLAIGWARGGRWRHLAERRFAGWPLLGGGIALQLAAGLASGRWQTGLLLASYAALMAFVVLNVDKTGMPVVLLGLLLNSLVVAIDDGMPVRRSALIAAGGASRLGHLNLTGKHHLAASGDHLLALSDIIPVKPLHEVVAVGDLFVAAGLVLVLVTLLQAPYVPRHLKARSSAAKA
jgi:hypothetical protein